MHTYSCGFDSANKRFFFLAAHGPPLSLSIHYNTFAPLRVTFGTEDCEYLAHSTIQKKKTNAEITV